MTGFKLSAIPLLACYLFSVGPAFLSSPDLLPFLFNKLALPVGLIIPVGAIFLTFLTGYGLLECVGVLLDRFMRPIWKTPGRSAVDAVASFAGSYSVGLLITNKVYKAGHYSPREAAIIATGFSTVSAPFMVVVAKTLNLMAYWNVFFWGTLVVTFVVTAITVRLWPLAGMSVLKTGPIESDESETHGLASAINRGLKVAEESPPVAVMLWVNLVDGLKMAAAVVPSILSVGLAGLLLAQYTPLFEWIGYLFVPVTWASGIEDPLATSSAIASGFAEMFLPALTSIDAPIHSRFVLAVVSVSGILFLSASIPCVLATDIPIRIHQLAVVWFLRATLSIPLASGLAWLTL
jgi:nucleoside recognition membrane protein YjiH